MTRIEAKVRKIRHISEKAKNAKYPDVYLDLYWKEGADEMEVFKTVEECKPYVCLIKYYDYDGENTARIPVVDEVEAETVAYEFLENTDCGDLSYAIVGPDEDWEDVDIAYGIGQ